MKAKPPRSKLYTRTGDRGQTSLFGGQRLSKDHPRIEAYGTVDELNAALGVVVSFLEDEEIGGPLQAIQNELLNIGSELATVKEGGEQPAALSKAKVQHLERLIDEYDARLPRLRTFILPSGPCPVSLLHLARAVCRRAERAVVSLSRHEAVNPNIIAYLNRLSDLLFVLARYLNQKAGGQELPWRKG